MADRLRKFEREPESRSRIFRPATYRLLALKSVERAVAFDRVEDAAVLSQIVATLGIGRKEGTNPLVTRPTIATKEQRRAGF